MFTTGTIETKTASGFKLKENKDWFYVGNYRKTYLSEIPIGNKVDVTYNILLGKINQKPYFNVLKIYKKGGEKNV